MNKSDDLPFTVGLGIPTAWARGVAAEAFAESRRLKNTEEELGLVFARILDREVTSVLRRGVVSNAEDP